MSRAAIPSTLVQVGAIALVLSAGLPVRAAESNSGADNPAEQRCVALKAENFSAIEDAPTYILEATVVKAEGDRPSHCRVAGYVAPQVGFKILLPIAGWNGRFLELGCRGQCGEMGVSAFCPLRRGYACITSDAGHRGLGADGLWGYGNWQAKLDWGYRAAHVIALSGKSITERYYGSAPKWSYFVGGSTGGRQALQEAQRFPWDFDGIVALAPPTDLSTVYMTFVWGIRATHDSRGKPLLGESELKLLTDSAVRRCDLDDGVKDGIIGDPLHCAFDPADLTCERRKMADCLTVEQIDAVRKVYTGPTTSMGMELSVGGPLVGSEYPGWQASYVGSPSEPAPYAELAAEGLRYLLFFPDAGPSWGLTDFDFDRDYKRLKIMQAIYESGNPDLRQFKAAGGKLMIFQGLNDNSVLPRSTIGYYEMVERTMGGRANTESFARLFLLPGVGHVFGGAGADTIDYLSAIEAWVEEGNPPDRLVAAHLKDGVAPSYFLREFPLDARVVRFSRPVFPYPRMAKYQGGDASDAASFSADSGRDEQAPSALLQ